MAHIFVPPCISFPRECANWKMLKLIEAMAYADNEIQYANTVNNKLPFY